MYKRVKNVTHDTFAAECLIREAAGMPENSPPVKKRALFISSV